MRWVALVLGLSLAAVVGAEGPAPWPAVRALVVIAATAAALGARDRRGHLRIAMLPLLALGVAGFVAGAGIGIPHLVSGGNPTLSAAGTISLASGLCVAGASTRALLRGASLRYKILAVPVGVTLFVLVIAPLTLSVALTNTVPFDLGTATPTDLDLAYEDVAIRADDGVELLGWYVPSTNGAAVVLLSGAGGVRSDELDHAAVLARHGYGVLLLDVRGHGGSGGDAMLWGWDGDRDVRAAVDYLAARPDVSDGRIAALGMSMGAEEAIGAAGSDDRLRAVVAEGATARGVRDEGNRATGVGGWFTRYADWATSHAADLMTGAKPPTKVRDAIAAASPRPIMIIAGGTQPAEIDAAHAWIAASGDNTELWIAPGAGHTQAFARLPAEWERRAVAFLDRSLLTGAGS